MKTFRGISKPAPRTGLVLVIAVLTLGLFSGSAAARSSSVGDATPAGVEASIVTPGNVDALRYIDTLLRWLGSTDAAAEPVEEPVAAVAEPIAVPSETASNEAALRYINSLLAWLDSLPAAPVATEPAPVEIATVGVVTAPAVVVDVVVTDPTVEKAAATKSADEALRAIDSFLSALSAPVEATPKGYVDLGNGVFGPEHLLRIRRCESTNQYDAVSKSGTYQGAYQFGQKTWNWRAELNGRMDLVGADIVAVSPADQDQMAVWNYEQRNPYNEWPVCSNR